MSNSLEDAGISLYEAAYAGDANKLRLLLNEYKSKRDVLNWSNPERYGRTPLVIASYYGKLEAVKALLATPGVDVNKGTDFGATALMFAAHRGFTEVVRALLNDSRIKANAKGTGGKWENKTALDVASSPEVVALLRSKGAT
eukprot:gene27153-32799_t